MELKRRYLYRLSESNALFEGTLTEKSPSGEYVHLVGPTANHWVDASTVRTVEELNDPPAPTPLPLEVMVVSIPPLQLEMPPAPKPPEDTTPSQT